MKNWCEIEQELILDSNDLKKEYNIEKSNKDNLYQKELNSILELELQHDLIKGYKSSVITKKKRFNGIDIQIVIDTKLSPVRIHFYTLYPSNLQQNMPILRQNKNFREFNKLCFYIQDKFRNTGDGDLMSNNCINPKTVKVNIPS